MILIARLFEWDMGHRMPNHDSLCKNPHGHRYKLEVVISGPMIETHGASQQDMVLDFGHFKRALNEKVIDGLDHSFMYWNKDEVMVAFAALNPDFRMREVSFVPTAEAIVIYLSEAIEKVLTEHFDGIILEELKLHETPKCSAIWKR